MNTADTFIEQLSHHLKQFSGVQRQDILDEIASHFEAGQNDPQLGSTPEERKTNLMNEMGSPSELGQGLRNVYRPNRLVDFLLVFIPVYLLFPLVVPLLLLSGKTQIKWEHPATIYIYFPLLNVFAGILDPGCALPADLADVQPAALDKLERRPKQPGVVYRSAWAGVCHGTLPV
jgi:hypothetical protein